MQKQFHWRRLFAYWSPLDDLWQVLTRILLMTLNELALSTTVGEKCLQLEGAYVAWQLVQAKVSGVPALHLVSPVIGADTIPAKKVNRKANGIKGLPNYSHASASFPTVTFGNENKSTPACTDYGAPNSITIIRRAVVEIENGVSQGRRSSRVTRYPFSVDRHIWWSEQISDNRVNDSSRERP